VTGLLAILAGVTNVAAQSNIAVPTIFALVKTVRDLWPHKTVDPNDPNSAPVPTDTEVVALMRTVFTESHNENMADQADLLAQIAELEANLPSAEPTSAQ